jgi:hypothetical protein
MLRVLVSCCVVIVVQNNPVAQKESHQAVGIVSLIIHRNCVEAMGDVDGAALTKDGHKNEWLLCETAPVPRDCIAKRIPALM